MFRITKVCRRKGQGFDTRMLAIGFACIALIAGSAETAFAQDTASAACEEKDLSDYIRRWRNKPPKPAAQDKSSLFLVPALSSNPATGFSFGFAGQYAFKGDAPGSLYSSINGSAMYTTKNQFLFQVKNNIYLKNNRLFLSGDWRVFLFSQSTYGLGTNSPEGGAVDYQFHLNGWETTNDSLVQPMQFDHYRFHQTISWQVWKNIYLGFGYHLDLMKNIVDERLDTIRPLFTSHYLYSKAFDFNPERYLISGLSFQATYDSRDNMVNPYKGIFASFNWRLNPEFLGSKYNANLLSMEWRSYHRLPGKNPRHLLGFWLMGSFSEYGKLPYLILPALGYDQRGRAGRGYTQGRYRGPDMIYAETEYRFPIGPCGGIFGGVLFANMTTTNNPAVNEKLFKYIAPGYGFGFRMTIDKESRTNLLIDFGFGKNSSGIYFGASETF
jgi:outer membrane protein assembly factor BamA